LSVELVVAGLILLLVGLVIGWLVAGRAAAQTSGQLRADLAAANERAGNADLLRKTLDQVEREREDANLTIATLRADHAARTDSFEAQLRQLNEAKEALGAQFAETAAKLLETAQRQFLERADERFKQSEATAGQGLKALLAPVTERLQRYEEGVAKVEAERRDAFGDLKGQIEAMRVGTERVSGEAAKLVNALRNAPKARGRWGEQQLKNVLESCGLSEHADFQTEVSVEGSEGRMRPDVIVRIPGGQSLVIDAKVSLNAYQDAFGAIDEAERAIHLTAHAVSMRTHVNALGNKSYWSQFADAPDYVIMFVPGEHFLSAALEHDPTMWDFAFDKKVLLATPTNLIAIARTVAAVWRQEKLAKEARQIGELGKELYDRLAVAAGHLKTMGGGLSTAVNNYNKFVGSFERNVLSTGRKFKELNIEAGAREIDEVPALEALARYGDANDVVVPLLKSDAAD
jgi:DNA recombination protein RmuC